MEKSVAGMNGLTRIPKKIRDKDADSKLVISPIKVQFTLCKWYSVLRENNNYYTNNLALFPESVAAVKIKNLQLDIDRIPALLMEEFVSSSYILDKEQYLHIVQALLVNLSDEIYSRMVDPVIKNELWEAFNETCITIQKTLNFLQNFFYEYFDEHYRMPKYCQSQFLEIIHKKEKNVQIEILYSNLFNEDVILTFHQVDYIKNLFRQVETPLTIFTDIQVSEFLFLNNFNSEYFLEVEIEKIRNNYVNFTSLAEKVNFLEREKIFFSNLKMKSTICFNKVQPSIKKQICDWITDEIKQIEADGKKIMLLESGIAPECKIQTTLSVAKLAVLIRLLVVDKIIINQPIAPALRTFAKLFTTLQKDEISFGSLETKYHAPDKNTIIMMRELLKKWLGILGKL